MKTQHIFDLLTKIHKQCDLGFVEEAYETYFSLLMRVSRLAYAPKYVLDFTQKKLPDAFYLAALVWLL